MAMSSRKKITTPLTFALNSVGKKSLPFKTRTSSQYRRLALMVVVIVISVLVYVGIITQELSTVDFSVLVANRDETHLVHTAATELRGGESDSFLAKTPVSYLEAMASTTDRLTPTATTGPPKGEHYRQQQPESSYPHKNATKHPPAQKQKDNPLQRQNIEFSNECGLYLAPSTIPGAGLGVFLGNQQISKYDRVIPTGDHTIPIVDRLLFTEADTTSPLKLVSRSFLPSQYTWKSRTHYVEDLGVEDVTVWSPGITAAANCIMDFINVKIAPTQYIVPQSHPPGIGQQGVPSSFHRQSDPGAGAVTYHHSRHVTARRTIRPGDEIFVGYGDSWFQNRKDILGPIPLSGDYAKANKLFVKFKTQVQEHVSKILLTKPTNTTRTDRNSGVATSSSNTETLIPSVAMDMWEDFLAEQKTIYGEDSSILAALPLKQELDAVFQAPSIYDWKLTQLRREIAWLEEHGACADNFHMGPSTLPQAGNGAFASRTLKKGSVALPVPLLHIPDRKILNMYHVDTDAIDEHGNQVAEVDFSKPKPPQLIINYCLGHRDSTMILAASGTSFSWINHNQTLANVQLRWASPERSQHQPALLGKTVEEMAKQVKSASLAMELVALRDIVAGEEIFLDYGDEWQQAWDDHVRNWAPPTDAESYVSAYEMNKGFPHHAFRTESEQVKEPYPSNLMLKFHKKFEAEKSRKKFMEEHPDPVTEYDVGWQPPYSIECRVLERKPGTGSRTLYTIEILDEDSNTKKVLDDVPQEALFFQDRPYTSDQFLDNAFRHDIRIPDEIFPEAWKNLLEKE
eukprot:scaffold1323_cov160-Amphora_coffeaeformis.AAC.19